MKYFLIEGIDGVGKTEATQKVAELLRARYPHRQIITVAEPPEGVLRNTILSTKSAMTNAKAKMLLFQAVRAQTISDLLEKYKDTDTIVISDRGFPSTIAYQLYGLEVAMPELLEELNSYTMQEVRPLSIFWIDCPVEVAIKRLKERGENPDVFEKNGKKFMENVRFGYESQYYFDDKNKYHWIDGTKSKEEVAQAIEELLIEEL